MNTIATRVIAMTAFALLGSACVSKGKYDQAVAQTATTRAELAKKEAGLARTADDLGKTQAELEAAQREAEGRAALYEDLSLRLKEQIDSGDLDVVVRDGRRILRLPNDVLFDTGRTEIKPSGQAALAAIANVLKTIPDRHFQVAGHTDDVPIHNASFAANWELSTGRALRVLHFLVGKGVSEATLSAAGYADVDPVAPNTGPDSRKKNRRTEIALQPNIDALIQVP